jgi:DNA adenine methylase
MAPPSYSRYWEPFMGSAALFFELGAESAVLADQNEDLVICFREVARDPFSVMENLDAMPNTRDFYLHVRSTDPNKLDATMRAARVIYLNKTGFRGLWRVNRQGQFNVPYGQYDRPYYNRDNILRASKALAHAELRHSDFEETLANVQPGDWVYLDPPYVPDRPWGDFKRYTPDQFGETDHRRLAVLMQTLTKKGALLMLTNSDTDLVRDLFQDWNITQLGTRRDIHLKSSERASTDLVVTNYQPLMIPTLPLDD